MSYSGNVLLTRDTVMANPNPRINVKFTQVAEKPLAKRVIGVRLTEELDNAVHSLPDAARSEWLRKAITEAAIKDGLLTNPIAM